MNRNNIFSFLKRVLAFTVIAGLVADSAFASEEKPLNGKPTVADANIAIVLRVVREVQTKRGEEGWKKIDRGYSLNSGDEVETKDASFSVIKFNDGGTVIRVQENSKLVVRGERNAQSMRYDQKNVELNAGRLGFDVRKRPGEQFRFTSPTSVASIKGTSGMFMSSGAGTMLLILEGNADLEASNGKKEKKEVGVGKIGIVNADGSITVRDATANEKKLAESFSQGGDKVKLKFRDKAGNIQEIEVPVPPKQK
ncbi:MAG: FecR family protein [Chloroherpetonaceae bacterium]|nr:FecR family protein [Chloroherpetonaceae bacterium]